MRGSKVMAMVGAAGLVVGLAACGSSSKASTGTTAAGASASATTAAGSKAPSGSAAKYCEVAKQVQASSDKFNAATAGAGNIKPLIAEIVDGVTKAEAVAPAEIKSQLTTVLDGFKQLQALFAKNNYDIAKVGADPDFAKISADQRFTDAGTAIDTFNQKTCGIASADTTTAGAGDTSTTTG